MISTPNREQKWVHVTLSDGKVIMATEGHPFRTVEGWRDAVLLKKGDMLILTGSDGKPSTIQINEIRYETKVLTTYNLEVANAHTFFVGEDGVLVHNCQPTGWIKRDVWNSLPKNIQTKFKNAIFKGVVPPKGQNGVIALKDTEELAKEGYTHKLKILGQGGDMRIYGKIQPNNHIVYDRIGYH